MTTKPKTVAKDLKEIPAESPAELTAKKELQFALHQQKSSLPVNSDGFSFYRSEEYEHDYILVEKMKAVKFGGDEEAED